MASIRVRPRQGRPAQHTVLWRDPDTRKQESMPFDDAGDAENFRRILTANGHHLAPTIATMAQIKRRSPTVALILDEHITGLPSVTARSRADYRRDATRHILPTMGAVAIDDLSPAAIKDWLRGLAATDLSDKTIANVHGLLSAAVNTAVQAGHRTDNPCRGIRLPRRSEHSSVEMVFLTPAEWAVLDAELGEQSPRYQLMFQTLAATGMRWGEVTALQVGDLSLDTDPPTVRISRAVKRDENSQAYVGTTKTRRSRRTISLPRKLALDLAAHIAGKSSSDLLFAGATGAVAHSSNVRIRVWLPAVLAAQNPERHGPAALTDTPRIHDLRHSHASWLIAQGVDLLTVQRRLGHESVTTTSDRYGHLMPGQQRAAASALDAILG